MPDNASPKATTTTATTPAAPLQRAAFPLAIVMLVGWAVWTFGFSPAPGWAHLLLTVGVFLLIWAIVAPADRVTRA